VSAPLAGVRACVFDAYGTLFDVNSAAASLRAQLGDQAGPLAALWRDKQLQYTWLRTAQGRHADFQVVTRDALAFALQALGLSEQLQAPLLHAFDALAVYPEVPQVLSRLKDAGMRTAILSNGTPAMLAALVEHAGIGRWLDAVISVEEVGAFKPHPDVYRRAVERLRLEPGEISFQSSNGWDAYAASAFGMRVVWCNRAAQAPERLPGAPDIQVSSLAALPELLGIGAS